MHRTDRRPRGRRAAHIHPRRQGCRAGGGRCDGPIAQGARRTVALCRHSRLDQGSLRHQGAGDPRRLARAGGFRAGCRRCTRRGAVAARGIHRDRPHQHDRVRLFRHRHQSPLRHAEKRLAAQYRSCARRLVVGRGGLDRRPHGLWRARHRHRRLLPDSCRLQRHRRLQADAAARAARRRRAVVVHPRQFRAARQFQPMLRHARCGARRRAAADARATSD